MNRITCEFILNLVLINTGVSKDKLISKSRDRFLCDIRKVYCSLSRKYTNNSLEFIGSKINRDHATVLHNIKSFKNLYNTETFDFGTKTYNFIKKKIFKYIRDGGYDMSSINDIEVLRRNYEININNVTKKFEKIIFIKNMIIKRLTESDVLSEIASMPEGDYNEFLKRSEVFLKVRKSMR